MPRKAGRRRKKRGVSFIILLFVVLLVAGFLARRVMQPSKPHYVVPSEGAYPGNRLPSGASRDALARSGRSDAGRKPPDARHDSLNVNASHSGENLTPADHRALDDLIREKSR